jgi:hypothetical protein
MAGFQVTLYGRIWVTPEVITGTRIGGHNETESWPQSEEQPLSHPLNRHTQVPKQFK